MLAPRKESYNNLDSILKSRDINLLTKVHKVKPMVFPVLMYGCETWTIKKTESWITDAFEVLCTLESPLDNKEIKPVNPKGSQPWKFTRRSDAEVPILWLPGVKSWSLEKSLTLGKTKGRGRRGQQRLRWWMTLPTQCTWVLKLWDSEEEKRLACCSSWGH